MEIIFTLIYLYSGAFSVKFLHYLLLFTFLSASQLPSSEINYSKVVLDDIEITEGWVREVPQGNPNTAGYLKIKNSGKEEIKLINIKAEFAEMSEFHLMKEEYGIMRMTPLKDGVLIPASSTVSDINSSIVWSVSIFKNPKLQIIIDITEAAMLEIGRASCRERV